MVYFIQIEREISKKMETEFLISPKAVTLNVR